MVDGDVCVRVSAFGIALELNFVISFRPWLLLLCCVCGCCLKDSSFARNHFVENAENMNSGSRVTLMDFLSEIDFRRDAVEMLKHVCSKGISTRLFSNLF